MADIDATDISSVAEFLKREAQRLHTRAFERRSEWVRQLQYAHLSQRILEDADQLLNTSQALLIAAAHLREHVETQAAIAERERGRV